MTILVKLYNKVQRKLIMWLIKILIIEMGRERERDERETREGEGER